MSNFKYIITIILLSVTSMCFAQRKNFSGTWMLSDQKSISGNLYQNGVPKKIHVRQETEKMDVEKTTFGQGDNYNQAVVETLYYNGKPFNAVSPSKKKKVITMKWLNNSTGFVVTVLFKNPIDNNKFDIKVTDTWSLNNEGDLIFIRKNENLLNGEIWESRSVYEKKSDNVQVN
ncbi:MULTISPECIES: hypothetical protein [Niastella]|uniref:Lipocalin-like domain-containing protein n=1 Tax=Niastella soli TaxID=2821487 RepID=A0ABS3Z0S2_9BACT|nr:hypothetical protein [Niastella soli]MBO9203275.1 hypothetical protein [Niastella soli]